MSNLEVFAYSFAVIGGFALIVAGIQGLRAEGMDKKKPLLMIGAGVITLLNVGLLFMPVPG